MQINDNETDPPFFNETSRGKKTRTRTAASRRKSPTISGTSLISFRFSLSLNPLLTSVGGRVCTSSLAETASDIPKMVLQQYGLRKGTLVSGYVSII